MKTYKLSKTAYEATLKYDLFAAFSGAIYLGKNGMMVGLVRGADVKMHEWYPIDPVSHCVWIDAATFWKKHKRETL